MHWKKYKEFQEKKKAIEREKEVENPSHKSTHGFSIRFRDYLCAWNSYESNSTSHSDSGDDGDGGGGVGVGGDVDFFLAKTGRARFRILARSYFNAIFFYIYIRLFL